MTPSKTRTNSTTKRAPDSPKKSATAAPRSGSAPKLKAVGRPRTTAAEIARHAVAELAGLIHKEPGDVTQLAREDDGWCVHVEVVELRRVPDTTDMMALYEVITDDHGALEGYRRLRRYVRGVPGEE